MTSHMVSASARKRTNGILLAGAAWIALMATAPALAGTYHATDDASLRAAIASAQGDADPSGTIILDNDITPSNVALPGNTKPITTVTPTSTVAFAGGNDFTISGAPIARDAVALDAGLDFALGDAVSASLTYGGQLSSRSTDQTARGTIRIAF